MDVSKFIFASFINFIFGFNFGVLLEAKRTYKLEETKPVKSTPINEESEKRILNMFGFTKRPKLGKDVQIPRLMQHLYKTHMGDYFDEQENLLSGWENGVDLPPDDVTSRVNTARSFHHIGKLP